MERYYALLEVRSARETCHLEVRRYAILRVYSIRSDSSKHILANLSASDPETVKVKMASAGISSSEVPEDANQTNDCLR